MPDFLFYGILNFLKNEREMSVLKLHTNIIQSKFDSDNPDRMDNPHLFAPNYTWSCVVGHYCITLASAVVNIRWR